MQSKDNFLMREKSKEDKRKFLKTTYNKQSIQNSINLLKKYKNREEKKQNH